MLFSRLLQRKAMFVVGVRRATKHQNQLVSGYSDDGSQNQLVVESFCSLFGAVLSLSSSVVVLCSP